MVARLHCPATYVLIASLEARLDAALEDYHIGVDPIGTMPDALSKKLVGVEALVHEFAHIVAQGQELGELPLSERPHILSYRTLDVSPIVSDALEVDTTAITRLTLEYLGVPRPLVLKVTTSADMDGNLTTPLGADKAEYAIGQAEQLTVNQDKASNLAEWLKNYPTPGWTE